MKNNILILLILFSLIPVLTAQTIVKMNVPPQAPEPLRVTVLFEEEVPEGMPVVLGLIGYEISGGIAPYNYQWIQNGNVVGTGDIVVITPAKGDLFELKAIDKNKCFSVSSISLKVISRIKTEDATDLNKIKIFPTLIENDIIQISLLVETTEKLYLVRIFDMKGVCLYQSEITGSSTINCVLPDGHYFVSVKTDNLHQVEKVIVKH